MKVNPTSAKNPNGWQNIELTHEFCFSMHCLPISDLRVHELDLDGNCWCHPIESPDTADYWVHNSLDGREKYEDGQKLN
jgi:hypothetical protein